MGACRGDRRGAFSHSAQRHGNDTDIATQENITVVKQSSVDLAEAKKNPIEIEGFKRAYLRDGVAWVKWAAWLESVMHSRTSISEWDAAEEFTRIRSKGDFFR